MQKGILFFADRLPPDIGGMEMHAKYFMQHFKDHPVLSLIGLVTKNKKREDCVTTHDNCQPTKLDKIGSLFNPSIIFFNSGRWIEEMGKIRKMFPKAKFVYRTGGNEILKAPLENVQIPLHHDRQQYWVNALNDCIDFLITNSSFSETRLREVGITTPFIRCVGGVNVAAIRKVIRRVSNIVTIFSAARFVPYKNPILLLKVMYILFNRGLSFKLLLAGDGPLLAEAQEFVKKNNFCEAVQFLGAVDNEKVCQEIAQANLYIQFSQDVVTQVPEGSYVHAEGMGRSILEALSAGTFVIAGHSGALHEIVTKERGILVSLDSAEQIANQIEPIVKTPPKRLPLLDIYSWDKIFQTYEEAFSC